MAALSRQTDDLRSHLAKLKTQVSDVQAYVAGDRASQLVEANSKLITAALQAENIAEMAVNNLREVRHSSMFDALTHTANRALMFDQMVMALASAREHDDSVAILFLNIDHFRSINTKLGHAGGDAALRMVASRVGAVLCRTDVMSRHGGDEFLVLLPDIVDSANAEGIAKKILAAVATPHAFGDVMMNISASLGIAMYPRDGVTIESLIERADRAMYLSKTHGAGGFRFYQETDSEEANPSSPLSSQAMPTATFEHESLREARLVNLHDANQQLVMALLSSKELEERAQDAHRQQIKFMAMVAHELRGPLAPMSLAASLLTDWDTKDIAVLSRLQEIIERQVKHMTRLINDLVDGSRISTGKLRLQLSVIDLGKILRTAVEMCRPAMEMRNQQMSLELPPVPLPFQGDEVRLTQVFSNLLDNASKYSPVGGRIALIYSNVNGAMVVAVSDNGIGMSAEALAHVFDLFVQDPRGLEHSNGGLGIGLAVVRELVDAHGGHVSVSSKGIDSGSEFSVTLPSQRLMVG